MHRMGLETSSELQFLAKPVRLRNHCTQRFLIIVLCIPKLNVWKGSGHADLKITLILNNSNALCHTISCHTVKHQNRQTPARKKAGTDSFSSIPALKPRYPLDNTSFFGCQLFRFRNKISFLVFGFFTFFLSALFLLFSCLLIHPARTSFSFLIFICLPAFL